MRNPKFIKYLIKLVISISLIYEISAYIQPIELTSISFNNQKLGSGDEPRTLSFSHKFDSKWSQIQKGKAIGAISSMDTTNDKALQFHFKYGLNSNTQTLDLQIYIDPQQPLSSRFEVTLDFMVAIFSQDYTRTILNMTHYQEHFMASSNRSYQLIMLLNGFSNLSLSGNITHAFNDPYQMYTIHYMSCVGQQQFMGWKNGEDYVLFTALIVPVEYLVQKFHVYSKNFKASFPQDYKYFYGYKGIEPNQFSGYFQQTISSAKFYVVNNPQPEKSYGLVFLPFKDDGISYVDNRFGTLQQQTITSYIIGISVTITIICLAIIGYFCYKMKRINSQQMESLNQTSMQDSGFDFDHNKKKINQNHIVISQQSDNRGPEQDPNLKMNTVEEVDPQYEQSLRGTANIRTSGGGNSQQLNKQELNKVDQIQSEDADQSP